MIVSGKGYQEIKWIKAQIEATTLFWMKETDQAMCREEDTNSLNNIKDLEITAKFVKKLVHIKMID